MRLIAIVTFLLGMSTVVGAQPFTERFSDLTAWKPLLFEKIPQHSSYAVVSDPDGGTMLRASSAASASGLVTIKDFSFAETPIVRWRWRVDNIYKNSEVTSKRGDDYPIRVYLLFKYDPAEAGFLERAKFASAKAIYGEYPPRATLNYVWASGPTPPAGFPSPYTDRARIVPLRTGEAQLGRWVDEEVNALSDYRRYFGEEPPATGALAIMSDSDNTKEAASAFLKFIEVVAEK